VVLIRAVFWFWASVGGRYDDRFNNRAVSSEVGALRSALSISVSARCSCRLLDGRRWFIHPKKAAVKTIPEPINTHLRNRETSCPDMLLALQVFSLDMPCSGTDVDNLGNCSSRSSFPRSQESRILALSCCDFAVKKGHWEIACATTGIVDFEQHLTSKLYCTCCRSGTTSLSDVA
jgi:hypothetical protein